MNSNGFVCFLAVRVVVLEGYASCIILYRVLVCRFCISVLSLFNEVII